jgi:hypothetical protein
MCRILHWAVILFVSFLWTDSGFAGPDMREGEWEITTQTEMPGMPFSMPPVTVTQCLTKENLVPSGQEPGQEKCEVLDVKVSGNTVSWCMRCRDEGSTMEGRGEITYHGDTFEGVTHIDVESPSEGGMQMTNKMKGRRIGDCD